MPQFQQFGERRRAEEFFPVEFVFCRRKLGFSFFQTLNECIFPVACSTFGKSLDGRVTNGPITCAATKIAGKLIIKIVARAKVIAVIALKHRADEARRAIAALRAVALDHFALRRMQHTAARDAFHRNYFTSRQQTHGDKTTIDRAISGFTSGIAFEDRDRTRTAIALGTAFLRAGKSLRPEEFEQRDVGGTVHNNGTTV